MILAMLLFMSLSTDVRGKAGHGNMSTETPSSIVCASVKSAEGTCLPSSPVAAQNPRISRRTLDRIEARDYAQTNHNYDPENSLNKLIQTSARDERRKWPDDQRSSGDWKPTKECRKGFSPALGRLQDLHGNLVESSFHAKTFAIYY